MTHLTLPGGAKFPTVGLGTWKINKEDLAQVLDDAVELGYRHFDCACDYGNEAEVGQALQHILSAGQAKRDELWITSKLWNTYHRREHVRPALEKSLHDLQLDYLDLYLIHFPISLKYVPFEERYPPEWIYDPAASHPQMQYDPVPILETWQAMVELKQAGLVREIGVCNFNVALIRDLMAASHVPPAVLQVESHPYLTQEKLLRFCQENEIAFTAFSPLGAQSYYELNMAEQHESLLTHAVIQDIASHHQRSPGQILLRWGIQRQTAVIPKATSRVHLQENIELFDFELTERQMSDISTLNNNRRFNDPGHFGEFAFNTFFPIYE